MLASVHGDRSLFDDAGADAVRALDVLGPHAAEPRSPIFEVACLRGFTAVVDRDPGAVAEQDRIPGLANHPVELVDLLGGAEDELVQTLAKTFQLAMREDAWRSAIGGVDAMFVCR